MRNSESRSPAAAMNHELSVRAIAGAGFTLIELMVVLVVIGLLAAVVGPQMSLARERTYVSVMITDLRNFATAEESYFYDFATYSSDPAHIEARGFQTSKDVPLIVNEATSSGWSRPCWSESH